VVLGLSLALASAPLQAEPVGADPWHAASELDPVRDAERAELFQVEPVPPPDPTLGAEPPVGPPSFTLAPEPDPVPPDVLRPLSRVLLTPASYTQPEARCHFSPPLALRFHQGARAVDVFVSLHCIDLAFRPVGTSELSPRRAFGPAAWELLELLRKVRPGDSRLYHVQNDWGARGNQARISPLAKRRWADAMPMPLRPFWEEPKALLLTYEPEGKGGVKFVDAKVDPLQAALARDIPEPNMRIRLLLHWYGSGAGPWSGYPSYEGSAALLLLAHTTPELLAAAQAGPLTAEQKEGAARLFASWEFTRERPKDGKLLPEGLRNELLEHSRLSSDPDKRKRAEAAFAPPPAPVAPKAKSKPEPKRKR
jgi:hypothetical protein